MSYKKFTIIQANLNKNQTSQNSFFNDKSIQDAAALLVSEPYCPRINNKIIVPPATHSNWQAFRPSVTRDSRWGLRAMIWVNKNIVATQKELLSPDIVAVTIKAEGRKILLISVYIPHMKPNHNNEGTLAAMLALIKETIAHTRLENPTEPVELIIAGDFDRWDPLWTGPRALTQPQRIGEAASILQLIEDLDLHLLTPPGMETFHKGTNISTIDLTMVTNQLAQDLYKFGLHDIHHGSDHNEIAAHFNISQTSEDSTPRGHAYYGKKRHGTI